VEAGKDAAVTSLIIPAYNPGPAIERTWDSLREFLDGHCEPWEVVFALDGCTDGTRQRLGRLAWRDGESRFRVVSYAPNRGKGYALRSGFLAARGDYRIFTDVDLAYDFESVDRVAETLYAGAAVVVANREHPESTVELSGRTFGYARRRRLQSRAFSLLTRTLLPITLLDTQAGLKGMTAAVADAVVPNMTCDGFGIDCEILAACARYNIPITAVPIHVRYTDDASSTGLRSTLKMVRELGAIRTAWPRNGYPRPAVARPTTPVPRPATETPPAARAA
jgi:dolichyl-phosphate beta-glucosyltransferase